jgi:hypothetical protein
VNSICSIRGIGAIKRCTCLICGGELVVACLASISAEVVLCTEGAQSHWKSAAATAARASSFGGSDLGGVVLQGDVPLRASGTLHRACPQGLLYKEGVVHD